MHFTIPQSRASLFGGIFLLVGLTILGMSVFQTYQDRRFAREGRSTQGIILTKSTRTSESSHANGTRSRTTHYETTYRFSVEGSTLEGRAEVSKDRWDSLAKGAPVEVLYLPTKPRSNRLAGPTRWFLDLIFGVLGLAFAVIGAVTLARGIRYTRLESRLREHGVGATGTVTELRGLAVRVNGVQQWRLQYEYQDFQGHRHVNTIDMPEDETQEWRVGDTGDVRYDSLKPADAVWLGREANG